MLTVLLGNAMAWDQTKRKGTRSLWFVKKKKYINSIQFKCICIALFTIHCFKAASTLQFRVICYQMWLCYVLKLSRVKVKVFCRKILLAFIKKHAGRKERKKHVLERALLENEEKCKHYRRLCCGRGAGGSIRKVWRRRTKRQKALHRQVRKKFPELMTPLDFRLDKLSVRDWKIMREICSNDDLKD